MIYSVEPLTRATRLYAQQKTYGERLKEFQRLNPVTQYQQEKVSLSPESRRLSESIKRVREEQTPISYGDPRVDNPGTKISFML